MKMEYLMHIDMSLPLDTKGQLNRNYMLQFGQLVHNDHNTIEPCYVQDKTLT